ncbi:hypothetical protein TNIN_127451 [Trichonephila inaurata madagascariensis]|uniref:Uncharacterized protein n=1 Tax=Trichonephila inaurata madagascariensis TaxID=2747483 RepID=A0A8X7CQX5_9ARAC|nr:hypothetical protein TNIN_127451 [Trichonephila inaurata madagascariensis]
MQLQKKSWFCTFFLESWEDFLVAGVYRTPHASDRGLSPQARLVLIYRHTAARLKVWRVTLLFPRIEPKPVVWKSDTLPLDNWPF